ncbi:MAG: hypothetical protein [Caudoviricetes sp.]|nr:MAG: hypothetical protein [Caudoviricetes sp.]
MISEYQRWCETAIYTQKQIDMINEHRFNEAATNRTTFYPYIPLQTPYGPAVRPESVEISSE